MPDHSVILLLAEPQLDGDALVKPYSSPRPCSVADRSALREANIRFDGECVDFRSRRS